MEKLTELLNQVKTATNATSNNELAAKLGTAKQRVSEYYKGKTTPDKYVCMKIAQALDKPLAEVICAVELDAEKDETRREAWREYFKRIGGYAASLLMTIALWCTFIVHTPAEAAPIKASSGSDALNINYARFVRGLIALARRMTKSAFLRLWPSGWPSACKVACFPQNRRLPLAGVFFRPRCAGSSVAATSGCAIAYSEAANTSPALLAAQVCSVLLWSTGQRMTRTGHQATG